MIRRERDFVAADLLAQAEHAKMRQRFSSQQRRAAHGTAAELIAPGSVAARRPIVSSIARYARLF